MDNPCKECPKMNPELFEPFEYGCDKPCQKAKDFYKSLGCKLDGLLDKLKAVVGEDNA